MAALALHAVEKRLGHAHVLRGIDLQVDPGEFLVLVGASGCGKSTLLRTIAGLETPDRGTVHLDGRDVTNLPPRERDVAMVFQSYALYPHLTVRDNLAFGLKLRGTPAPAIRERIADVAAMLGLGTLLARYPRQLSGGQRQRVAMGRAIARRPKVFLFDEPLSNLDAALRAEVRVEIRKLHAELRSTMVYVTHDQTEAMTLADRLVVMHQGLVEQAGPPLDVFARPATRFVAGFLGSPPMNFFDVDVADGVARADGLTLPVPFPHRGRAVLGVRPHELAVDDNGPIALSVDLVESLGTEAYARGRVGSAPCTARVRHEFRAQRGEVLRFAVAPHAIHLFDAQNGRALG